MKKVKKIILVVGGAFMGFLTILGSQSCSKATSPASPFFPGTPTVIPYSQIARWGGSGNGNTQFNSPEDIAVDNTGNIFVADTFNNRIVKYTNNGTYVTQWNSGGGALNRPRGIAVDALDNVYVADSGNHLIKKFNNTGGYLAMWGGLGSGNGQFNWPLGLAIDRSGGFLYAVDSLNYRVQKFTTAGVYQTKWGTNGTANGQFDIDMYAVAVDGSGNVYVGDGDVNGYYGEVQKFTSTGSFISSFSSPVSGQGLFYSPEGLVVNPAGDIFVTDYTYGLVRVFDASGNFKASVGLDVPLYGAVGLAMDAAETLYITSTFYDEVYIYKKN